MFWLVQMADGASLVLLSGHMNELGFSGVQISYVFATMAVAALISPLIVGWLADHFWPSQIMLGACYLIGTPILVIAWMQTEFLGFWLAMAGVALIRTPARMLSNVIVFHHFDAGSHYGQIRAWGTMGWIFVSWCLGAYLRLWEGWEPGAAHMGDALLVAAAISLLAGCYCLTLPHTPPKGRGASPLAFMSAFRLLRDRDFAVLVGIGVVSSAMSPFFYNFSFLFLTDVAEVGLAPSTASWVQSIGPIAEVLALLCLTLSLRRLGLKRVLLLGVGAQMLRFALFAVGEPVGLIVAAMSLHGLVFTFLFAGLAIAVEQRSSPENRASAQGLISFFGSGVGALVGNFIAGRAYDGLAIPGGGHDWELFFLFPACVLATGLIAFAVLFGDSVNSERS